MTIKNAKLFFVFAVVGIFFFSAAILAEESNEQPPFSVYRGVSHVHSQFSHDSSASLSDILEEARKNEFDFVVITDHNSMKGKEAYAKMRKAPKPLLIFGEEISTPDGHLIALGIPAAPNHEGKSSQEMIDWIHAQGGYAILPHPFSEKNPWENWKAKGWDGLEMFNFGHGLFEGDVVDLYFQSLSEDSDTLLKSVQQIPKEHTAFWDESLAERPIAGLAGTDAHLKKRAKSFATAFKSAMVYVLIHEFNEQEIVNALGTGRDFMVFETRGRASHFSFQAEQAGKIFQMGEELKSAQEIFFKIHLPSSGKIRLIHNGLVLKEEEGAGLTVSSKDPGAYRVEVYQGEDLWIFSNAIYVKEKTT